MDRPPIETRRLQCEQSSQAAGILKMWVDIVPKDVDVPPPQVAGGKGGGGDDPRKWVDQGLGDSPEVAEPLIAAVAAAPAGAESSENTKLIAQSASAKVP